MVSVSQNIKSNSKVSMWLLSVALICAMLVLIVIFIISFKKEKYELCGSVPLGGPLMGAPGGPRSNVAAVELDKEQKVGIPLPMVNPPPPPSKSPVPSCKDIKLLEYINNHELF